MAIPNAISAKIRNMSIVAAFLVVIIHCRPEFAKGTFEWWVKQFLEGGVTHIAVPFFFVTSGYFLASHYAGMATSNGSIANVWSNEVWKRVRTLVLPFFIWNLLYWLFLLGGVAIPELIAHKPVSFWLPSLEQWGFSAAECPLLAPLWYVRALFLMVLLSPIFWKGLEKLGIWFLVLLFILYSVICPFTGMPGTWPLHEYSRNGLFPVLGFFYFALGMAIRGGVIHDGKVKFTPLYSLAIGLAFVALRAFMLSKEIPGAYFAGFLSVPFVLYGVWRMIPTTPWPSWLTAYSFSVYLIHKFVMYVIKEFVNPGSGICQYLGVAIASFVVYLGIAVAIHRMLPKFSKVLFCGR